MTLLLCRFIFQILGPFVCEFPIFVVLVLYLSNGSTQTYGLFYETFWRRSGVLSQISFYQSCVCVFTVGPKCEGLGLRLSEDSPGGGRRFKPVFKLRPSQI